MDRPLVIRVLRQLNRLPNDLMLRYTLFRHQFTSLRERYVRLTVLLRQRFIVRVHRVHTDRILGRIRFGGCSRLCFGSVA